MRPRSVLKIFEKPFPDGAVVRIGRARDIGRGQRLHQVATRDDADELAVAHDRDTFDAMIFQRPCDFRERSCRRYGDHGQI